MLLIKLTPSHFIDVLRGDVGGLQIIACTPATPSKKLIAFNIETANKIINKQGRIVMLDFLQIVVIHSS